MGVEETGDEASSFNINFREGLMTESFINYTTIIIHEENCTFQVYNGLSGGLLDYLIHSISCLDTYLNIPVMLQMTHISQSRYMPAQVYLGWPKVLWWYIQESKMWVLVKSGPAIKDTRLTVSRVSMLQSSSTARYMHERITLSSYM